MAGEPFTAVGRIARTHGLKGEVSVIEYYDGDLSVLRGVDVWLAPPSVSVQTTRITGVRPGPKGPIATLQGLTSIEQARELSGSELLVRTEDIPAEWHESETADELLGARVVDRERGELGVVDDIIVTGANDVLVVNGPFGQVLVPVIDDVDLCLDETGTMIEITLLPGLMPDEEETS